MKGGRWECEGSECDGEAGWDRDLNEASLDIASSVCVSVCAARHQ